MKHTPCIIFDRDQERTANDENFSVRVRHYRERLGEKSDL